MKNREVIELENLFIMQTYKRFPIALEKGEGVYLWDYDGKEYLDFLSGISVNALGYNHPVIRNKIIKQSSGLLHTSNLFYTQNQSLLASFLVKHSKMDKVFFCNSGAEANEGAIKLARKWGKGRFEIITALNSFHGRTLATLTATGQTKYQAGFEPLVPGFKHVPFNDVESLKSSITKDTVAILLEPVQAEGGIQIAKKEYLRDVESICKENNLLLILDEVQTGLGRTGKFLAYEHFDILPDIITLAKSLGCGFPIGAMLAKGEVAESFEYGNHASTFGGGEFVTGIALEFLKLLYSENLIGNAEKMGDLFLGKLKALAGEFKNLIEDVRGIGLLLGIQFKENIIAADMADQLVRNGLLSASAGGNVLRFAPPLIVNQVHIEKAVSILHNTFSKHTNPDKN
jgi:predicted acetylornithine/succinylornithine family transaminase